MIESTPKLTVAGLIDPVCPKCKTEMYGVTQIILGGKNKHFAQCPDCNYKTKAK